MGALKDSVRNIILLQKQATRERLAKNAGAVFYMDARKATGSAQGVNSPLTNPVKDLSGVTAPYTYSNSVTNGDFANGATGWTNSGLQSMVASDNKLEMLANSQNDYAVQTQTMVIGRKYYVSAFVWAKSNLIRLTLNSVLAYHSGSGQIEKLSGITVASSTSHSLAFVDTRASLWDVYYASKVQVIDITALGLENLTAAQCDALFPFTATTGVTNVPNDATLVNFAGTTSSGYATVAIPNGNSMPFIKPEGADDYGAMANTASMDITGTEDFAICGLFMTGATLQTGYILAKNTDTAAVQYSMYINADGRMEAGIENTGTVVATAGNVLINTVYEYRLLRIGGRLKFILNSVEKYNQANVASLVSKANIRLFARSTNAGGTTHSNFNKDYHAYLLVARGTKCTEANTNKFCELAKKGYV